MRISDWSSDVCSSDLGIGQCGFTDIGPPDNSDEPAMERFRHFLSCVTATGRESCADLRALDLPLAPFAGEIALIASRASVAAACSAARRLAPGALRSEERRVGKACVSTGRSRWWPYH